MAENDDAVDRLLELSVNGREKPWAKCIARYRWRRLASRLIDAAARHDVEKQREVVSAMRANLDVLEKAKSWPHEPIGSLQKDDAIAAVRRSLDSHVAWMDEFAALPDRQRTVAPSPEQPEHGLAAPNDKYLHSFIEGLRSLLGHEQRHTFEWGPYRTLIDEIDRLPLRRSGLLKSYEVEDVVAALLISAGDEVHQRGLARRLRDAKAV